MDRRAFLQTGIGALLVGNAAMQGCRTTFATSSGIALSDPSGTWSQNLVRKTRINLKPVMTDMIHTAVWEGPCRFDMLTPSEEMAAAQKRFGEWAADGRSS
jgi:hypothetical protein